MAEQQLTIVVGNFEVLSSLDIGAPPDGRTLIRVTSECQDQRTMNLITLPRDLAYSSDQAEYDIEDQRHRFAEELAARVGVRALAQAAIVVNTGAIPVAADGRRLAKPTPSA